MLNIYLQQYKLLIDKHAMLDFIHYSFELIRNYYYYNEINKSDVTIYAESKH